MVEEDRRWMSEALDVLVTEEEKGCVVAAARDITEGEKLMSDYPIGDPASTTIWGNSTDEVVRALLTNDDWEGSKKWIKKLISGPLSLCANDPDCAPDPLPEWTKAADVDSQTYGWALSMIQCNAIKSSQSPDKFRVAMLAVIRLLNHSCRPNAATITENLDTDNPIWNVYASRDIKKGEEVAWSYVQDDTFLNKPTEERRKELKQRWAFDCMCVGCDPPKVVKKVLKKKVKKDSKNTGVKKNVKN